LSIYAHNELRKGLTCWAELVLVPLFFLPSATKVETVARGRFKSSVLRFGATCDEKERVSCVSFITSSRIFSNEEDLLPVGDKPAMYVSSAVHRKPDGSLSTVQYVSKLVARKEISVCRREFGKRVSSTGKYVDPSRLS
jgi:hypothetical protein